MQVRILLLLAAWATCVYAQTSIQPIPYGSVRDSYSVIGNNLASLRDNKVEGAASSADNGLICFSGAGGKAVKSCIAVLPPSYTVSGLPAAPATGSMAWVTNGSGVSDCTTGGGSSRVLCYYTGSAWAVWGGGSGSLEIEDADGSVGAQSKLRFRVDEGLVQAVTDAGDRIDVLSSLDTAVSLTRSQAQTGADLLVTPASGSGSAYVASMSPALDAYTDGMVIHFRPDVSNSGACTLNIDGQGAVDILQSDGTTDPGSGDLVAGRQYALYYDSALPAFVMPPTGGGAPPSVGFGDLTGDPADNAALDAALLGKADSSHTHSAADITSGTLDVARLPNVMATAGEGYWFPVARTRNTTAGSWTALRTYVHKTIAPYGMTLRRVLAYTTGFGASQGFTAGVYSSSGTLLAYASVGNVSAGAVMHELTLSSAVTLSAGQVVWIAMATDGSGSFGIVNDSAAFPGSVFGATILIGYGTAATGSNGSIALPNPLGTVTNAGGSPIWTMFLP